MRANFLLGNLKVTPAARRILQRLPYDLLARHAICEHGHISAAEKRMNEVGLKTLGRIVSRYRSDPTDAKAPFILVVTESTWNETVISVEAAT